MLSNNSSVKAGYMQKLPKGYLGLKNVLKQMLLTEPEFYHLLSTLFEVGVNSFS